MTSTVPPRESPPPGRSGSKAGPRPELTGAYRQAGGPWAAVRRWCRGGPGRSRLWVELIMVVWLCWVYDMIANLAPLRNRLGHQDAGSLLHTEKWMHMDPEAAMDHWMSHHHTLAVWVANYYDNAHFVVTLTLVAVLWWKWPDRYRPLRNSLILLNVFGMVVYWFVPTAPPRLYDPSVYLDVVARTHAFGSWHSGTLATAANELAAMPSLHIGWACWSALALKRVLPRRWWADLVWLYPMATAAAVLSTGNHFLLDVLAGAADFAIATWIADRLHRWWTSRHRSDLVVEESHRLVDEPTMSRRG